MRPKWGIFQRKGETVVPTKAVKMEEGAEELMRSENLRPYLAVHAALLNGQDPTEAWRKILELPLEKRYVWRVVSALQSAFGDLDTRTAEMDLKSLEPEELAKILKLTQLRPAQFCLFFATLVGKEKMREVMTAAVKLASD